MARSGSGIQWRINSTSSSVVVISTYPSSPLKRNMRSSGMAGIPSISFPSLSLRRSSYHSSAYCLSNVLSLYFRRLLGFIWSQKVNTTQMFSSLHSAKVCFRTARQLRSYELGRTLYLKTSTVKPTFTSFCYCNHVLSLFPQSAVAMRGSFKPGESISLKCTVGIHFGSCVQPLVYIRASNGSS